MIWESVCIFCVFLPLCQRFPQELLDAMSVQAQRFSSHHNQEVARAFSKPGNFASTVMTIRIEKSLKNAVFILIPVFSDFLFLTLQGRAWSSQSSCGKYLMSACCSTISWVRSIPGVQGHRLSCYQLHTKQRFGGVHTLLTAEQVLSGTLWFPLPVEFMLPRYLCRFPWTVFW